MAGYKFFQKPKKTWWRINFLALVFFIFGLITLMRLFQVQVLEHQKYQNIALETRTFEKEILPQRGEIFAREKEKIFPVAINIDSCHLYARPAEIAQPEELLKKIAPLIKISSDEKSEEFKNLLAKLSKKNDYYELIKKNLSLSEVEEIKRLKLIGLDFEFSPKRFYPEGNFFSHLIGFVGYSGEKKEGKYGLEQYFENILSGKEGIVRGEKSPGNLLITTAKGSIKRPKNGANIILTIERPIQIKVCLALKEAIEKYQAEAGNVIVVEPKTGRILALCNWPHFDPNEYGQERKIEIFKNSAISSQFEPGSVFKVITFAAALETGKISPATLYEDKGSVKIDGYTIKNAADKVYGQRTMAEVLEKSINTGAIFAARQIGLEQFRSFVEKFGFGRPTNIQLPGEIKGDLKNLNLTKEIYLATASFGQGLTATPLQMVMAFAAIANEGKLMRPYLIEEIKTGNYSAKTAPQEIQQVISPETSQILKAMMVSAVKNGWGKRASVKGYTIAGKTGTAQVAYFGQYSDKTIHSFIGFGPAENPRFVILVKLDNPQLEEFSDRTAAPIFGQIAEFLVKYFEIPPTEE